MRRTPGARVWVAAALVMACGETTGPDEDRGPEPIQTDRSAYVLARDTIILLADTIPYLSTEMGYSFRNLTTEPVYMVRCHDPDVWVQRREADGSWQDFWYGGTEDCLGPPIVVAPGADYEGVLDLGGAEYGVEKLGPQFPTNDFSGSFRLLLRDVVFLDSPSDYPVGPPVDPSFLYSNTFTLSVR